MYTLKDNRRQACVCAKDNGSCPYHPNVDESNRVPGGYYPTADLKRVQYTPAGIVQKGGAFKDQPSVDDDYPEESPSDGKLPTNPPFASSYPKGMTDHEGRRLIIFNDDELDDAVEREFRNLISFKSRAEASKWVAAGMRGTASLNRPSSQTYVASTDDEVLDPTPVKNYPRHPSPPFELNIL